MPGLFLPSPSRAPAPRRTQLLTSAVRPALCLLAQMTWPSLRAEFPALSPAQLHRVLSQCQAVMDVGCIAAWQPSEEESPAALQPGEPLASRCSSHHALVTHRLPPKFLRTNQTGNSPPWGSCSNCSDQEYRWACNLDIAEDAKRTQKGLGLFLHSQVRDAAASWLTLSPILAGRLHVAKSRERGAARASASLPPSAFQMRCWSPSTITHPSSCPAGASKWTWRWRCWMTTSTGTSFTSATSSGACRARAPTPARSQAQHPQR